MPCSGCLGDVGSELLVDEGEGLVLVLLERGGCMCTELRWSRTRRGMWSVCARVSACYGHAHTNLPLVVRAMNRDRSGHALQHCGQGRAGQLAAVLVLRWGARSAARSHTHAPGHLRVSRVLKPLSTSEQNGSRSEMQGTRSTASLRPVKLSAARSERGSRIQAQRQRMPYRSVHAHLRACMRACVHTAVA